MAYIITNASHTFMESGLSKAIDQVPLQGEEVNHILKCTTNFKQALIN